MNIGIYIDGDNISYNECEQVIDFAYSKGNVLLKKIFGDWTKTEMKNWQSKVFDYGMESIQIFRKNKHKNSTDVCLITELLFDCFRNSAINTVIIASNDSDFSYVCSKLKLLNINVIAMCYEKNLLCNYATSFAIFEKKKSINDDKPIEGFTETIFRYSKLKLSEKKMIDDKYIVKYKKRKYVVNSNIIDRSVKKLKKSKKKTLEKYQEIFKIIPYEEMINILDS